LLIIREALSGTTRFMDFSRALPGWPERYCRSACSGWWNLGAIETIPVSETSLYHEYVHTEMGRQLFPVATALRQWGGDYLFGASQTA
jgi:DNA-binding HxlR family transcriptional regulator